MKQQTLAMAADLGSGFEQHRRATRRDVFLQTMEQVVPWAALCAVIGPHYPKAGKGRPPVGLERMLRMYFVQHWFNLADEACEEALLDSTALRRFVGIDLGRERVPDSKTPPITSAAMRWRTGCLTWCSMTKVPKCQRATASRSFRLPSWYVKTVA